MALGAMCIPDNAYLDQPVAQPVAAPAEVLRSEFDSMRAELETLTTPLARWRAESPAVLGAGLDMRGTEALAPHQVTQSLP